MKGFVMWWRIPTGVLINCVSWIALATLIIIPVVYTIFSDIADKFGWKQHLETTGGGEGGSAAPAQPNNP